MTEAHFSGYPKFFTLKFRLDLESFHVLIRLLIGTKLIRKSLF